MNSKKFITFLSLGLLVVSGWTKPTQQWQGIIEYEDTVKVIKNPQEPALGELVLDLEEDLVIGNNVDEHLMFFKWFDVAVDPEGILFILDGGNFRIQVFDIKGKYLYTIGKEGEGPGELRDPRSLHLDEQGNLFVKDGAKIHLFDVGSTGQYVESYPVPMNCTQFKVLSDGNIIADKPKFDPENFSYEVVLLDGRGRILTNLASFPALKMESMFIKKDRFTINDPMLYLCPYLKDSAIYGFSQDYILFIVNAQGEIIQRVERAEPRQKITKKDKRRMVDKLIALLKVRKPDKKEEKNQLQKRVTIPDALPFFDGIHHDEAGNIYVRREKSYLSEEKGNWFDFFDKDGRYLYKLKVHVPVTRIRRGYIYSRGVDRETGYLRMKRYRIKNWEPER